jgi:LacI family transcriptional regulator
MNIRMKDIARELGLSVVTVSKVVREQPDVAERTRQRVLKRLEELNYRPNPAARSLRKGRSYTVGLIIPDLVHAFWAQVAKAMLHSLRDDGYALLISSAEEDAEYERTEIEQLLARRVDAIAIASAQWSVESFRRIEQQGIPYVLLDRKFAGLHANLIDCDNEGVGFDATSHLIAQGCTRVAHIRGPEWKGTGVRLRNTGIPSDRSTLLRQNPATSPPNLAVIRRPRSCSVSATRRMAFFVTTT